MQVPLRDKTVPRPEVIEDSNSNSWVAVKEFKLSYHNGYI